MAYVFVTMGNSPRPGVWALEKSNDYGKTWQPWQYFADSAADCAIFFNKTASTKPSSDEDVICTTEFSKIVPLEGGEVRGWNILLLLFCFYSLTAVINPFPTLIFFP